MIKKIWSNTQLVCGNHGDDFSRIMLPHEGHSSLFYSCPEYKGQDCSCNNKLSLVDFEKMLSLIEDVLTDDEAEINDLTGMRFKIAGAEFRVVEHGRNSFRVAVLNKKSLSKK